MAELSAKPRVVNKFEGRLITILRGIVRLGPMDAALPCVFEKMPAPRGLGTTCVQLACDSLAKGCIQYLAKIGGWRHERFLRDGQPIEGRFWERIPLAERQLTFSRHALEFLIWLTAEHPTHAKMFDPPFDELTLADELLFFLAYDALRDTEAGPVWRSKRLFARNALCRLHYAEEFTEIVQPVDFQPWVHGLGAAIVEVMQSPLAERWYSVECGKRAIGDWKRYQSIADAQDQVVESFLGAVEQAKRLDLARFLLHAAVRYCTPTRDKDDLLGGLQSSGPPRLAERYRAQRQWAVLARVLHRMKDWQRQARSIGFMDDGYPAAQFLLNEWDAVGADDAIISARKLLRQLEPVRLESEVSDEPSLSHTSS